MKVPPLIPIAARIWLMIFGVSVLTLFITPQANAIDVSEDRLVSLGQRASSDDGALNELRQITSVDGAPIEIDALLAGATPFDVSARIDTWLHIRSDGAGSGDGTSLQQHAQAILATKKYATNNGQPVPTDPTWLGRIIDWFEDRIPTLPWQAWIVMGAIATAGLAWFAATNGQRRIRRDQARKERLDEDETFDDPDRLEALADEAERTGSFADAVRLRFSAGLLRLQNLGVLSKDVRATAGRARSAIDGEPMHSMSTTFEYVAYGDKPATANDATDARSGWRTVLGSVGSGSDA